VGQDEIPQTGSIIIHFVVVYIVSTQAFILSCDEYSGCFYKGAETS
jgi:hypothetical protein